MPDFSEKAASISCWGADRVGTGLLDGVGAGATNARRISSVVAFRTYSSSFTMHKLRKVSWKSDLLMASRAKETSFAQFIVINKSLTLRFQQAQQ